jgi:ribosomal protein S18 acetylase RimI-like enzyme
LVSVRYASPADAPAIWRVTREAFLEYVRSAGIESAPALRETEADVLRDIKTKTALVAVVNGDIAGSLRLSFDASGTTYLSRFGVDAKSRSLGAGGALLGAASAEAKRRGAKRIELHTALSVAPLARFYEKRGFSVAEIRTDAGYERAAMRKEL